MPEMYVDLSRGKEMNRYHELKAIVQRIYADGIVSDRELGCLDQLSHDAEDGYYVAADRLHDMSPNDPQYAQLESLVSHLRACWKLMDYAATHGHTNNEAQKSAELRKQNTAAQALSLDTREKAEKEQLDLNLSMNEMLLLLSLRTPELRREANREFIADAVRHMLPERRQEMESRITRTMAAMEKERLNEMQMNRLMGLELTR